MILWTLRHTKPYNPNDVCYGQSDFDVAASFESEFPPAIRFLQENCHATKLYSSPLQRCYKLAEKASETLGLSIEKSDALKEMHFGDWENVKLSDVPKSQMAAWKADLRGYKFPNGESFHEVDKRIKEFIRSVYEEKAELLFVSHAGVIAAIEHSICGLPETDFVEASFPYAMVTRFEIQMDSNGHLSGSFETLYGGMQQPSLVDYIQTLG